MSGKDKWGKFLANSSIITVTHNNNKLQTGVIQQQGDHEAG